MSAEGIHHEIKKKDILSIISGFKLPIFPELGLRNKRIAISNSRYKYPLSHDKISRSKLCGFACDLILSNKELISPSKRIEILSYNSDESRISHSFVIIETEDGEIIVVDPTWKQFTLEGQLSEDNILFYIAPKGNKFKVLTELIERFQALPLLQSENISIWVVPIYRYLESINYFDTDQ